MTEVLSGATLVSGLLLHPGLITGPECQVKTQPSVQLWISARKCRKYESFVVNTLWTLHVAAPLSENLF